MRSSIIAKNGIFLDLETIEWHKKSYSRNRLFLKIQLSVSMSSSLSYSFGMELMQPDPLQLPHTFSAGTSHSAAISAAVTPYA